MNKQSLLIVWGVATICSAVSTAGDKYVTAILYALAAVVFYILFTLSEK